MKNYKKLLVLSLVGLMLVGCNDNPSESVKPSTPVESQNPSVTPSTPQQQVDFNIDSEEELRALVNKGSTITDTYELTTDIYYSSFANDDYYATIFDGTFNGNGHTIYLLAENLSDTGVFYKIGANGKVDNLNIRLSITAGDSIPSVGGVANYNEGLITNVAIYGENFKERVLSNIL